MEDAGNSKKRSAGVQLSRENPGLDDDEETPELETGTFKRASEEVLASRRIVKVRRQPTAPATNPSSNPFASIRLTSNAPPVKVDTSSALTSEDPSQTVKETTASEPKTEPNAEKTDDEEVGEPKIENAEKTEEEKVGESKEEPNAEKIETESVIKEGTNEVEGNENDEEKPTTEKISETSPVNSFQQLSSGQNAFSGFGNTIFSFGSVPREPSTGSLFGVKTDQNPIFRGFGLSNNGSSIFGGLSTSIVTKTDTTSQFPSMKEVPLETGEENETSVFTADSVLFEFTDGSWKEKGKGELKVNISKTESGRARLVMRARGNYRLILNAGLYPDLKLTNMDKKGVTFACVNNAGEGKEGLSTIALKFKDPSVLESFKAAVMDHKGSKPVVDLKTPENSPKASDE